MRARGTTSARELFTLVTEDRARALAHAGTSVAAVRLFELLPRHPVVSVAFAIAQLTELETPARGA